MVTLTVTGIDTIVLHLDNMSRSIAKASVRSMNRGIASGRSLMAKLIAADTRLKQKDVRDALTLTEATVGRPVASLGAGLKRIPLVDFDARQTRRGVSYSLGSRGRAVLASSFFATMPTGHRGVFMRKGEMGRRGDPKLEKIQEKFGPSIGHVFIKYRQQGEERAIEMFKRNFGHELEIETNGFVKAGPGEEGAMADAA